MAGDPLFYEVRNEFYRDVQGALLVYDVSDKASFAALDGWLEELHADSTPQTQSITARDPRGKQLEFIVVCANKVRSSSPLNLRYSSFLDGTLIPLFMHLGR